jgi:antitoxin FitA
MASLTIRSIDDKLKSLLRQEAARHGHSMEEEARQILRSAVMGDSTDFGGMTLTERINRRFAGLRADEIELPARHTPRKSPNWTPSGE